MVANTHIKSLLLFIMVSCCISSVSFAQDAILKHSYTFNNDTPADVIGNADGLLKGGKIEDGKYITTENGQYIELPANLIKLSTYTTFTLEAYIVAGEGNARNTHLFYYGNKTERWANDYIFISAKNSGFARTGIACKNYSNPWTTTTDARCNTLDDGLPHLIVTTFDNKELKLYVDGLLVYSLTNEKFPDNLLENLGDQVAYLAKSGYSNDPTWIGTIDAFNIYEGILDSATIEKSARDYLPEQVIAVRNQLTDLISSESISLTRLDTLENGIYLNNDWKYHSGDDLTRAEKEFDDSSWPIVNSMFKINDLNGESWTGIGWFRKKFKIDSSLFNQVVAFSIFQNGASEIYLNGKLIKRYGEINADPKKEKLYNPNSEPFIFVFDSSEIQVLALRYSNHKAHQFIKRYSERAAWQGFYLRINNHEDAISGKIDERIPFSVLGMLAATYLVLTILHLLLYLFYARGKENLYYSIFTGSLALYIGSMYFSEITHSITEITYILDYLNAALMILIFANYVFFLYAVFYAKMPRQFRIIYVIGTAIIILNVVFKSVDWFFNYVALPFMLVLTIEGLRIIILAVKRKKRNSLIIGLGVLIFFLFFLFIAITSIFRVQLPTWIQLSMIFSGILSLPITMTIYLARENAKTKSDLENRIVQVQELSEKAIEHEKREAELKVENTRKEVELQKAAELQSAYQNLEIAHENLKSAQKQLIQSEKMASLGELTAGIAHEIQNPLNFVNNFSELSNELVEEMKEELAEGSRQYAVGSRQSGEEKLKLAEEIAEDIKQNLEKINHHGKRAESIVKGMLQHSRTSSGQKESTDINALCDEYLRLAYHGFRAKDKSFNADYKTEFDPNLPKINVVPQDIGRVLLNLINNAFYAVDKRAKSFTPQHPEGGGENPKSQYKPEVLVSTNSYKSPGDLGVKISVKDNGEGIPSSIIDKIFQPFFTTKPTGQGTGLGLSLSYDIVNAHGGTLDVDSQPGQTTFTIKLTIE